MLLDNESTFSDAQAVTVTAPSTNIIDLRQANRQLGAGERLWLYVFVKTTFTAGGAATLVVDLETDNDVAFGSATLILSSGVLAVASLTAKTVVYKVPVPANINERYMRLNYTVATGPMTAGAIAGVISKDVFAQFAHDDGIDFP